MVNILIADDNIHYVKNLINFVIGKDNNIKIANIASNGLEVLDIIRKNSNIDLVLLDLKMPKLNGMEVIDRISNMKLEKFPDIIVISGENNLINKLASNSLVIDFINKTDDMLSIYSKLKDYEEKQNYIHIRNDLSKKILSELIYIGYNLSHIGTKYIKDCILVIYESKNPSLANNLENYVYKKVACMHNVSFQKVKTNIAKATDFMYAECNMDLLKDYFHFNDVKKKPTPKKVISTILNKL